MQIVMVLMLVGFGMNVIGCCEPWGSRSWHGGGMIVQTAVKCQARHIDGVDSMESMQLGSVMLSKRRGSSELLPSRMLDLGVSQVPGSLIQSGLITTTVSAGWLSQTRFLPRRCRRRWTSRDGREEVVRKESSWRRVRFACLEMGPRVTKTAVL